MLVLLPLGLTFGLASTARAQLEPQPTPLAPPPPPGPLVLETPPALVTSVDPVYPEEARAAGRMGDVVLRILIDDAGGVERVDVVESAGDDVLGRALDWAALGAAAGFVFSPAEFCRAITGEDGLVTQQCGPSRVAIDYKTTFALEEKIVEVPTEPPPAPGVEVKNYVGVVREAGTKAPLEGVEVSVEVKAKDYRSTTTNAEGRFELAVPPGDFEVAFTLSDFDPAFVDESFQKAERTETVVYLTPRDVNRFETVVRRRRAQKDVSKVALTRDEVRKVPGTFGDPLRVIENLPGLARAPFIGGALIVRGANPNDSGVYFDGVEVPLLYHFGGLTSVVNAEFLEDINFYPGGFGAYYGRATAGIVDVTSRKLELSQFRGYAEVDLVDSGFFFGGPLKLGELPKVTFALAARRSYIDGILPLVLDALPLEQAIVASPVYWDYQAKVESRVLPDQQLSLFLFGSDDDLKVIQRGSSGNALDIGFHTQFHRLVATWDWKPRPGIRHRFRPFAGLTRVEFEANNSGDEGGPEIGLKGSIDVWNWGLRDELEVQASPNLTFRVGLDHLGQTFGTSFDIPLPLELGSFPRVFPRIEGTNQTFTSSGMNNAAAVYAEAEISPWETVKVTPGVRAETTVVSYFADELPDGTTSDPSDVTLSHVDPRLTARWEILPKTSVKGAFGVYHQLPQPEELNPDSGNPNLVEPRAVQLIGGVEQALTENINLDVQIYYTYRDLLVETTGDAEAANDGSGDVNPLLFKNGGRGRTVGAEILLRHEITEHLYGWIAYTLSRTDIDLDEGRDRFFLTDQDQTHILTVVAQTQLPWGFTLGARFRAVSGNPTNVPLGSVHDLDTSSYNGLGSTPQSTRLPTFHQLDLRVDKKFVFETFSMTTYLDLLNVYNQQNAEGFLTDFRSRQQAPIPSLPILPVLGMSGEF